MAVLAEVTFSGTEPVVDGHAGLAGAEPAASARHVSHAHAAPDPDDGHGDLPGAVSLAPQSSVTVDIGAPLPAATLAVEVVVRPAADQVTATDAAGTILGAGPMRLLARPVPGGLGLEAAATTAAGVTTWQTDRLTLFALTWQRLVAVFTGGELLVFCQGRLVGRRVLATPAMLAPATAVTIGESGNPDIVDGPVDGATLPMAVALVRIHDAVPADLQAALDTARAGGEGELASLAADHPHLVADVDLHDERIKASSHRHYPDAEFVWHPLAGAHVLTGPIRVLWLAEGAQGGQLGYPLTDVVSAADFFRSWTRGASPVPRGARSPSTPDGMVAQFEGGIAVQRGDVAVKVAGQILVRWRDHGGAAGFLGNPVGPEGDAGAGGLRQDFEGGVVFWHRDTGAHAVFGPVLDAYQGRGGPAAVGFPVCEQVSDDDIGPAGTRDPAGLSLPCSGGILRLPDGVAPGHFVSIAMYRAWEAGADELGPITADEVVRASGVAVVACERGVLSALPGMQPRAVTSLELVLQEAFAPEVDDGIELIGSDDTSELMVTTTVAISSGGSSSGVDGVRARATGDDSRRVALAVDPMAIDAVRLDTTVRITFEAWDHDTLSANDPLGGLDVTFDVDNVWGLGGQGGGAHEERGIGGDGAVIYTFRLAPPGVAPATVRAEDFREHLWWRFDNFSTPNLDRDLFTETFEDVEAGMDLDVGDALVEVFYHAVYRGSAATGNCYGMSLEAVRTHRGIGLWSAPLSGVGPPAGGLVEEDDLEPWIARRFNRSQGTQLSGAMTFHLLRSLANGSIVRAGTVFDEVAARTTAGEVVILSMFSLVGGGGHAVVAYHTQVRDDRVRTIFVADPNTPWGRAILVRDGGASGTVDWSQMSASRIDVQTDGSWRFHHQGGTPHTSFWSHAQVPTATLMAIPTSVALAPSRTPLGDVASHLAWLTGGLVLLNGAETESMSTGAEPPSHHTSHVDALWGLRTFMGSEVGPGDGWMSQGRMEEVWGQRLAATPGLLRLPVLDGGDGEVYARTGRFPDEFSHTVRPAGSGELAWEVHTGRHGFGARGRPPVSSGGTASPIALGLHRLQGPTPSLEVGGGGARADLALDWRSTGPGQVDMPSVHTTLPVGSDITSRFEVLGAGLGVLVQPGADVDDLEVRLSSRDATTPAVVRLGPAGAHVRLDVRPADLVSPLGAQVVARHGIEGDLLERVTVAPIA